MPASKSNLANTQIDFVVATTQASINSGLLEYLSHGNQPATYLCFTAPDKKRGIAQPQIPLNELLVKTGGVNPFDIPDGTDYADDRITAINRARFIYGIKMQVIC